MLDRIKNPDYYVTVRYSIRGGRGVFAKKPIEKGSLFLSDHVIRVTENDCANYIYMNGDEIFVGLGLSSLINHSENANSYWSSNFSNPRIPRINFYALRDIDEDEEILHDYQWDPDQYPKDFIK